MLTDLDSIIPPSRYDDERPSNPDSLLSSRQDPFDLLATETIGDIFSYACPNVDLPAWNLHKKPRFRTSESDPAVLSLICKRWHAITTVNHSLWTSIIIHSGRISAKDWARWGFLQLRSRLQRSGTYPLNIYIYDSEDAVSLGIFDIIMPHSERWRSIALTFFEGTGLCQKFNTLIGRLPLLEHLEVAWVGFEHSEDIHECKAFLSTPKLKSLCITKRLLAVLHIPPEIHIPRTQILELTLRRCDLPNERDFQEMLESTSVSLISLTLLKTSLPRPFPKKVRQRKIRLPQLRRLRFLDDCITALNMLICPSLEELEIFYGKERTITRFLDGSSCSLTRFKICSLNKPNAYQAILKHLSLSTLRSISLAGITDRGLDLLNFDSLQLFPSLETLHLYLRISRYGSLRLLYHIKKMRKVIDSRACTTSLDPLESIVHGPQATTVQWGAGSSLKKCRFHFNLELEGPVRDDYWNEEPITALQSFCISKKIRVSLKTSYWWRLSEHPTMRSDDGDLGIEWDLKFP